MNKKQLLIIFTFFLIFINPVFSNSIEIKARVLNEIITNIDIENEKKYLFFLNNNLKELEKSRIEEIAKNSLIKEIVKKNELDKIFDLSETNKLTNVVEKNLLNRKNIKNVDQFKVILKKEKINYERVKKKMLIETLWNKLIYQKFSNNIIIDKEDLRKQILNKSNNQKTIEYNLSEIIFNESISENLDFKLKKIKESINQIGFENTANILSLSNSGKNGGLIGWVSELQISNVINKNIKNLKVGEISKPIKIRSSYLLIKVNEKREFEQKIDIDGQLEKLINQEMNRQLTSFSIIFYKRIKKNIEINEY